MSAKRLHVMFDDDDILLDAVKEIVKNKICKKTDNSKSKKEK